MLMILVFFCIKALTVQDDPTLSATEIIDKINEGKSMHFTLLTQMLLFARAKCQILIQGFFHTGECIRTNVSIKSLCPIKINVDVSVLKGRENLDSNL